MLYYCVSSFLTCIGILFSIQHSVWSTCISLNVYEQCHGDANAASFTTSCEQLFSDKETSINRTGFNIFRVGRQNIIEWRHPVNISPNWKGQKVSYTKSTIMNRDSKTGLVTMKGWEPLDQFTPKTHSKISILFRGNIRELNVIQACTITDEVFKLMRLLE